MTTQHSHRGRSLFWPLILIGIGLIWLLGNLNILQPSSLQILFRLWPLLLIVIGLDLLFGRQSPLIGTLLGLGTIALIIVLMLVGPSLGWVQSVEVKTASYSEPVGDATSASITIGPNVANLNVRAADTADLFAADLRYVGEIDYSAEGQSQKVVRLTQRDQPGQFNVTWPNFLGFISPAQDLRWDVTLSNRVDIDLNLTAGVGDGDLNLGDVRLTHLEVTAGVGSLRLTLPSTEKPFDARLATGTGDLTLTIEQNAALNLQIKGGVGSVTLDVPDDAAVRLDASTGVGSLNVPSSFQRTSGSGDNRVGESGVWETAGFASAARTISIKFEGGVGDLTVR